MEAAHPSGYYMMWTDQTMENNFIVIVRIHFSKYGEASRRGLADPECAPYWMNSYLPLIVLGQFCVFVLFCLCVLVRTQMNDVFFWRRVAVKVHWLPPPSVWLSGWRRLDCGPHVLNVFGACRHIQYVFSFQYSDRLVVCWETEKKLKKRADKE